MATFRAKARAVDLLGKGQIADLPTAISELWKNGYDAYADNVEARLYLKGYKGYPKPLFMIMDDGDGMSKQDIQEKWIVLGTAAKAKEDDLEYQPEPREDGKPLRVKMGEKGIGRLSVAYLGSPMLLISKQKNDQIQTLFLDWRIFELYDFFLEDITIPIRTVNHISEFSEIFDELKKEFLSNFKVKEDPTKLFGLKIEADVSSSQSTIINSIVKDIEHLDLPSYFNQEILSHFADNLAHGTVFMTFAPIEQLLEVGKNYLKIKNEDSNDESKNDLVSDVRRGLAGFYNLFKYNVEEADCKTAFNIFSEEKGIIDLLAMSEFFNVGDFNQGDFSIIGKFNKKGQFEGSIRVYDVEYFFPKDFQYPNNKAQLKEKKYGELEIKVGYVEGKNNSNPTLKEKTTQFGGLYVYRDDFRVLPYGRSDQDFLSFENRRLKNAGRYVFSSRMMFGYIGISKTNNPNLKDKAGREGFIQNDAFRTFKNDLIDFFIYLADTFYGRAAKIDTKKQKQEAEQALKQAEEAEKKREKEARKDFNQKLASFSEELALLETKVNKTHRELEQKIKSVNVTYEEIEELIQDLADCKIKMKRLVPPTPVRFELTDTLKKKLDEYETKWKKSEKSFDKQELIDAVQEKLKEHEVLKSFDNRYQQFRNRLINDGSDLQSRLQKIEHKHKHQIEEALEQTLEELALTYNTLRPTSAGMVMYQMPKLEKYFLTEQSNLLEKINGFIAHLEHLDIKSNEDFLVDYYKKQAKQLPRLNELAQLGIAVEIIDHEFNALYSSLNYGIKNLERQIQANDEANRLFRQIKLAVEHLEHNYKLITPLYRVSGKLQKNVAGSEFEFYLRSFFKKQLENVGIKMEATSAFQEHFFYCYESHFKAVFINIINNAIYWLLDVPEKRIILDFKDENILILNSGLPIEEHRLESIFDLFVSFRPQGRGIGLFLCKNTLRQDGFDLYATNDLQYNYLGGACFVIPFSKKP